MIINCHRIRLAEQLCTEVKMDKTDCHLTTAATVNCTKLEASRTFILLALPYLTHTLSLAIHYQDIVYQNNVMQIQI